MNWMLVVVVLSGLYLIIVSQALTVRNFISTIVFKVIPLLLGIACLIVAFTMLGWFTIPV